MTSRTPNPVWQNHAHKHLAALLSVLPIDSQMPAFVRFFVPLPAFCAWQVAYNLNRQRPAAWAWHDEAAGISMAGVAPIFSANVAPGDFAGADRQVSRFLQQTASCGASPPGGWGAWPHFGLTAAFATAAPAAAAVPRQQLPWGPKPAAVRAFAWLLLQHSGVAGAICHLPLPPQLRSCEQTQQDFARRLRRHEQRLWAAVRQSGHELPRKSAAAALRPGLLTHCGEAAAPWQARVEGVLQRIAAGTAQKIVAARFVSVQAPLGSRFSPWHSAIRMRLATPRAKAFFWQLGRHKAFVGATPEVLARVQHGQLQTHAVAGTARQKPGMAPKAAAQALLASDKDLAEHAAVVSALRRDLAPLCTRLQVHKAPRLLAAGTLWHLETPVRAQLKAGTSLLAVAARLHPTPALAGTPTAVAMAYLQQHEAWRGLYGGLVGWLDAEGGGTLAVAIRSALVTGRRAFAFAGAGIVAGSQPEAEWAETQAKLAPTLAQLQAEALPARPSAR